MYTLSPKDLHNILPKVRSIMIKLLHYWTSDLLKTWLYHQDIITRSRRRFRRLRSEPPSWSQQLVKFRSHKYCQSGRDYYRYKAVFIVKNEFVEFSEGEIFDSGWFILPVNGILRRYIRQKSLTCINTFLFLSNTGTEIF